MKKYIAPNKTTRHDTTQKRKQTNKNDKMKDKRHKHSFGAALNLSHAQIVIQSIAIRVGASIDDSLE